MFYCTNEIAGGILMSRLDLCLGFSKTVSLERLKSMFSLSIGQQKDLSNRLNGRVKILEQLRSC